MTSRPTPARGRDLRRYPGFGLLTWFCMIFLYAPILIMAIYSFNKIRSITTWGGFSFDWYAKAIGNAAIQQATANSLIVAVTASSVATLFATAAALAMVRGRRFRGQEAAFGLISLPLLVPEIISAVATLLFFVAIGVTLGMSSVMLAHIVFCIPFAYLPIAARLEGIEPMYEEAARDLYADGWRAFYYVTLPLLFPGVVAGFMLAFIISLDDFIITNMVTGPGATTLPLAIYGMVRTGLTPEINAISTLLLCVSMAFVTLSYVIGRKGRQA
jgi:spermidine/putrescine transport system permease protein